MKKRILWFIALSILIVITLIIVVNNALYLNWSPYKVPSIPVGGFDKQVTYAINPETILSSLDQGGTNVFLFTSQGFEGFTPSTWSQNDYLKVANALHQFVWKEPLENWDLYDATFWITQHAERNVGIDNAYLVYFRHKNKEYIVHSISIDLLKGEVTTGENLYQDKGWKGFRLSELAISNVNQTLSIGAENGGKNACFAAKDECRIRVSLGSYLAVYDFLHIPFYRYEWNWAVSYYNQTGDTIFRMTIDPYTGKYKILNTN